MIKEKYLNQIKEIIHDFTFDKNPDLKFFIYGSSLKKDQFGDVDLGILGVIKENEVIQLREKLENSTSPFLFDVIDFNKVSETFKKNVFDGQILWIKH